tara:strand:+ start:347 stop:559 length:213 start_codon:yes stop_codon:yes gene_type:complete
MYKIEEINREGAYQSSVATLEEAKKLFRRYSKLTDHIVVYDAQGRVLYKHQRRLQSHRMTIDAAINEVMA